MDEPARKRRRTTPPEEHEQLSSPLKKPPRRPSFASPTKSSLSRFNPNLLPPKTSNAPRPTSRGEIISQEKQAQQHMLSDTTEQPRLNDQSIQDTDEQRQGLGSAEEPDPFRPKNVIARSPKQGRTAPTLAEEQDVFAPRNAIPRSPRRAHTPPALVEGQDVFAPRSAIRRSPIRAHTPLALVEKQDVFAPGSTIRRSPIQATTPSALVEKQDVFAPRSAIRRSPIQAKTPPALVEEQDVFAPRSAMRRSPIRATTPPASVEEQDVFAPRSAMRRSPIRATTPPALVEEQDVFAPRSAMRRSPTRATTPPGDMEESAVELPSTSPLRELGPPDTPRRGVLFSSPSKRPPLLGSKIKQSPVKAIKQLLRRKEQSARPVDGPLLDEQPKEPKERQKQAPLDPELEKRKQEKAQLLRELGQLENEVTRCTHEIDMFQNRAPEDVLESGERDKMVAFVNQICSPSTIGEEQTPTVSNLLCSFLPFSAYLVPLPKPETTYQKPVSSHRPKELDDPLPYLKLFTSLDFTSQISLVSVEQSSKMHQKHTISITDPQKLLAASVVATIDSTTSDVIGLSVHLPSWAERDLGNFTRPKAQENDLSATCWAIGSYWELAKKRAEFWHKCESTFARFNPDRIIEDTENFEQRPSQKPTQILCRKDLRRHLGQDSLTLQDKYVLLKINWRIAFDWTGEAESEIGISPALPALWSETDSNDSLKKIPETFNALLQRKSVFEATKTMVALLMEAH